MGFLVSPCCGRIVSPEELGLGMVAPLRFGRRLFYFAFGSHLRRGKFSSFVRFPLTGCAGAPRDDFAFKLIFDLYDRTAPHRFAEPPELRGASRLSIESIGISMFRQSALYVPGMIAKNIKRAQLYELFCATCPSPDVPIPERFKVSKITAISKFQRTRFLITEN